MHDWKVDRILELLKVAGETALRYADAPPTEVKADSSPVTVADREIEQGLAAAFDRPQEGSYMIGEETVGVKGEAYISAALEADRCYIVDPIDGTAPYASQVPLWGISIGFMSHGTLLEGAMAFPYYDEAFISCHGVVFRATGLWSGNAPEVEPFKAKRARIDQMPPVGISQASTRHGEFELKNQLFAWSSCVGSFRALLHGCMLGYIHASKLWDVAGGFPILRDLGFVILYRDGTGFDWRVTRSGAYEIAPGDRRWRHNRHCVVAPDRETAGYIWRNVKDI